MLGFSLALYRLFNSLKYPQIQDFFTAAKDGQIVVSA
jgi:hypothetical protein